MTIATNTVDKELVEEPHCWDIKLYPQIYDDIWLYELGLRLLNLQDSISLLPGMIEQFRTG